MDTSTEGLLKHYRENKFHDVSWPDHEFYNCQLFRYKYMLDNAVNAVNLLDIGCNGGQGPLTFSKRTGRPSVGVDLNTNALRRAMKVASYYNIPAKFINANVFELILPDLYDVVSCFEFVEHWHSTERVLQTCERFLAPGGRVFISTPDKDAYDDSGNEEHVNMMNKEEFLDALKDRHVIDFVEREQLLIAQYEVNL